jgi:hypothetical protein
MSHTTVNPATYHTPAVRNQPDAGVVNPINQPFSTTYDNLPNAAMDDGGLPTSPPVFTASNGYIVLVNIFIFNYSMHYYLEQAYL